MQSTAAPPRQSPAVYVVAPLLGLAGLALTLAAFWPGIMTWDSVRQYDQALSGQFDDWHPPAMEWLWRQLLPLHPGPALMFALQITLLWVGTGMLAWWAARLRKPWLAVAIVASVLMPAITATIGAVVKDCLMAGALLTALGVLALAGDRADKWSLLWRLLGIALLVAASTLRFNAFMATAPIGIALVPPAWRNRWPKFFAGLVVVTGLMIAALPTANRLLGAEKSGVELSLVIFDLGGISRYAHVDAFPPVPGVKQPVKAAGGCYSPVKWDSYSWWVDPLCPVSFYAVQDWFADNHVNPELYWLRAIAAHPNAYFTHRFAHFSEETRFLVHKESEIAGQIPDAPNDWGFRVTDNPARRFVNGVAAWLSATPLEWPITWIGLGFAALVLAPGLPNARLIVPMAASGLFYGLGYAGVGVASELRYHLWTMLMAALANAILVADVAGGARLTRVRVLLAYTPTVAITLMAMIWRLLPA